MTRTTAAVTTMPSDRVGPYWVAQCDTCEFEMPFVTEIDRDDWTLAHASAGHDHESFTVWRGYSAVERTSPTTQQRTTNEQH